MASLLIVAWFAATAAQAPQPSPPTVSSQTAFAEAFASANWSVLGDLLTEDAKVSVVSGRGKEQSASGRDQGIALLSSVQPTLGPIAVKGCEFSQLKFGPSVVCQFTGTDKGLRDLVSIATLKNGRVSEFTVGFSKK